MSAYPATRPRPVRVPAKQAAKPAPAPAAAPTRALRPHEIEAELAHREAAHDRLMSFITYVYPYYYPSLMNQLIASALELVESRRIKNLMILAPPQHGKSSEVSQFFPPWYLGRNPDHDIILCSYNASLAEQHSFRARQIFREDRYSAVFPHVNLAQRSKSLKHWRIEGFRGSMKTAGVGGGVTGFGAKLLLVDDPLRGWKDANSEIIRQQQINWWDSEADTRVAPYDGVRVLCFTHWHEADIGGILLKRQATGGQLWHVLRLPALAETPQQTAEWCERHNVTRDRYLVADCDNDLLQSLFNHYRRRPDQPAGRLNGGPGLGTPHKLTKKAKIEEIEQTDEKSEKIGKIEENTPFEGYDVEIGGEGGEEW